LSIRIPITFGSVLLAHPKSGGRKGRESARTRAAMAKQRTAKSSHRLIRMRFSEVDLSESKKARVENRTFFGFLRFNRYINRGTATVNSANKNIGFRKLIYSKSFYLGGFTGRNNSVEPH
jgi:hypothetical protein